MDTMATIPRVIVSSSRNNANLGYRDIGDPTINTKRLAITLLGCTASLQSGNDNMFIAGWINLRLARISHEEKKHLQARVISSSTQGKSDTTVGSWPL